MSTIWLLSITCPLSLSSQALSLPQNMGEEQNSSKKEKVAVCANITMDYSIIVVLTIGNSLAIMLILGLRDERKGTLKYYKKVYPMFLLANSSCREVLFTVLSIAQTGQGNVPWLLGDCETLSSQDKVL
jgi:hypothetical protein